MRSGRRRAREGIGTHLAYRDLLLVVLGAVLAVLVAVLPHQNPKAKAAQEAGLVNPPGNVVVDVKWSDGTPFDVDLWVEGPGDVPVGYSNKGGRLFNLLRDDLGVQGDFLSENYESAFSRGVVAGEYVVNLHLYRGNPPPGGLAVDVQVSVKGPSSGNNGMTPILKARSVLHALGEELTVVRFRLDERGTLVSGSVSRVLKKIRSAR
jgi:hypothetical protein